MGILLPFALIGIISFFLAIRSMRDFDSGKEVRSLVRKKKKGTIVFLKDKVKHYSS